MENFLKNPTPFEVHLEGIANNLPSMRNVVEEYYKSGYFNTSNEKDTRALIYKKKGIWKSVQDLSPENRKARQATSFPNERTVKFEIGRYASDIAFINKHQEACFSLGYPHLYEYMCSDIPLKITDEINSEIQTINRQFVATRNKLNSIIRQKIGPDVPLTTEGLRGILTFNSGIEGSNLPNTAWFYPFFFPEYYSSVYTDPSSSQLPQSEKKELHEQIIEKLKGMAYRLQNKVNDQGDPDTDANEKGKNIQSRLNSAIRRLEAHYSPREKAIILLAEVIYTLKAHTRTGMFGALFSRSTTYAEITDFATSRGIKQSEYEK